MIVHRMPVVLCVVGFLAAGCAAAPLPSVIAEARPVKATATENTDDGELVVITIQPTAKAATATSTSSPLPPTATALPDLGPAPELRGIVGWVNSEPVTLADLRGKVVLVNFWTYGCYNCRNTLPYVTKWYDTYHDQGFVVLGIHTPEFAHERDIENVKAAVEREGIHYPVAQDNDYVTWRTWRNRYWPAEYFVDATGRIRYVQIGEGGYERSEAVIRQLLAEAAAN